VRHDRLPEAAGDLDDAQRQMLDALADALAFAEWYGEALQAAIFEAARLHDLPAGRGFAAIYAAFLGQASGPRAGWLLASLDRDFVVARLRDAAAAVPA
jgi:lysyl-tRNA synthetase class I